MKLSFMTWICPKWSIEKIVEAAKTFGYEGVELRVQVGHAHKIDLDTPRDKRLEAKRLFASEGKEISCVATSLTFSMEDKAKRQENVDLLKKYVDLAHDLGCPNLRVFGGVMPAKEPVGVVHYVAEALAQAGIVAKDAGVYICLETHDHFSHSLYVAETVRLADCVHVAALWDILHPIRHLESIQQTYEAIGKYVRHVHLHDAAYSEDLLHIDLTELGEGIVPHKEAMALLDRDGFDGHFSVEMMKGDPEHILSQYAQQFRAYLEEIRGSNAGKNGKSRNE